MKTYVIAYLATGFAFLAADAVWLTGMNRVLYQAFLGPLLLPQFKLAPAALFYLVYILGIVFFAVAPALATGQWSTALLRGAAFGLVAYATYDLTNQATLKDWPVIVTVADMGWGTIATATGATVGFFVTQALGKGLSI